MRRSIKILLAGDFFFVLALGMFTPIYAIFVEKIGGSILEASGAWSVFALTSGVLMYATARWEDRSGYYEEMLVLGFATQALAYLGYAFVQRPIHLFLAQIILGLGTAVGSPAYDALYSLYLDKGKVATDWAVWEAMSMIVSAFAAIVGGVLASYFGFRTLFMLMFCSGVVGTVVSAWIVWKKYHQGNPGKR